MTSKEFEAADVKCWTRAKEIVSVEGSVVAVFTYRRSPYDKPQDNERLAARQFRMLGRLAQEAGLSCPKNPAVCSGKVGTLSAISLQCSPVGADGGYVPKGQTTYSVLINLLRDKQGQKGGPSSVQLKTSVDGGQVNLLNLGGIAISIGFFLEDEKDNVQVLLDDSLSSAEVTFRPVGNHQAGSQMSCSVLNTTGSASPFTDETQSGSSWRRHHGTETPLGRQENSVPERAAVRDLWPL
jgi:hypothetical protein